MFTVFLKRHQKSIFLCTVKQKEEYKYIEIKCRTLLKCETSHAMRLAIDWFLYESNTGISWLNSHAELTKTLCPNFSKFTFLHFLKLQYSWHILETDL